MPFSKFLICIATTLTFATPALAGPTVGVGLSFSFGGGAPQAGIGLRVFSNNKRDSFVGSAGVDYIFGSNSFRGTVGGAYLGNDTYFGLDLGLGFDGSGIGFGIGAGGANTKAKVAPPAAVQPIAVQPIAVQPIVVQPNNPPPT